MAEAAVQDTLPNHGKTIYPSSHIPLTCPRIHHKSQNQRSSHSQSFDKYPSGSKMSRHFREKQLRYNPPAVPKYLAQNEMYSWNPMFGKHCPEADHIMTARLTLQRRMIYPDLSDGKSFRNCMRPHHHIYLKGTA